MIEPSKKRVFIISLDGATFDVLNPLLREGLLPNLQRLMNGGSYTELESVMPFITPAAWTSFMTGKLPERHGILDFLQFVPKKLTTSFSNYTSIRTKTVWDLLQEENKQSVVINLPMTYPPPEINGFIVSGFDTPSTKSQFTHPKSLKQDIYRIIPEYSFDNPNITSGYFYDQDFFVYLNRIRKSLKQRYVLADHLLDKTNWDVFMVQFQALDWLQHYLWDYIDQTSYPNVDEKRRAAVYACYSYLDKLVGKLLMRINAESTCVIILSDHGFGAATTTIHPNNFLKEWGFLSARSTGKFSKRLHFKAVRNAFRDLVKLLLGRTPHAPGMPFSFWNVINWKETKAYVPIADIVAFCYINQTGREPFGTVSEDQYDKLCMNIRERFLGVIYPLSNKSVFSDVLVGKDFFRNWSADWMPDLILVPADGFTVNKEFSSNMGFTTPHRTGTHRRNGMLILNGTGIKPGFDAFEANIIDVVPTILHILGLPVPSDMDGRPILEAFVEQNRVIVKGSTNTNTTAERHRQKEYSVTEETMIEKKLKDLGYL